MFLYYTFSTPPKYITFWHGFQWLENWLIFNDLKVEHKYCTFKVNLIRLLYENPSPGYAGVRHEDIALGFLMHILKTL